jgi:hypothetical protein
MICHSWSRTEILKRGHTCSPLSPLLLPSPRFSSLHRRPSLGQAKAVSLGRRTRQKNTPTHRQTDKHIGRWIGGWMVRDTCAISRCTQYLYGDILLNEYTKEVGGEEQFILKLIGGSKFLQTGRRKRLLMSSVTVLLVARRWIWSTAKRHEKNTDIWSKTANKQKTRIPLNNAPLW